MIKTWQVEKGAAGQRLDVYLASQLKASRSSVARDIRAGRAMVNGRSAPSRQLLEVDDRVEFQPAPPQPATHVAPTLEILYEDESMLIVDKPAGLAMHAGAGEAEATVADFAREHTTDTDQVRPGIVHRLDRDTSGALVLAKSGTAKDFLQKQFAARKVNKTYLALLEGSIEPPRALIDLPLGRDEHNPLRQAVRADGKPAQTKYKTIKAWPAYSLVEAKPLTGRTHQIRIHFEHVGYPVVDDKLYGRPSQLGLSRQFLHATEIQLVSPAGEELQVSSPLPPELEAALTKLGSYNE